ncbi:hypothetical protein HK099_007848 [Clydaea vesicula]|uniref:4-aminobutyrate aminotransferase n=1 Tax=Clydaea vesicula TaxID=447962 RepID=A0AAD5Y427_9FUNG|nr:hypothetical protein HK099_007848 [Clydaea vesicula]KAJ3396672.1 hypothetical protein HDU92_002298 [Lobulomyces angularis]
MTEYSFLNEPEKPTVISKQFPGEKSAKNLQRLDKIQDTRSVVFVQDLDGSIGNYIKDIDGNLLLDVYCQISSIAVGYNNPRLTELAKSDKWVKAAINRPCLGVFPCEDWAETLESAFLRVAPKGLNQVFTATCGSTSNEIAFKACFMHQQLLKRGGSKDFTNEELTSCMVNEVPGSPNWCILSFKSAFHGRTLGTLSTTRSKPIHKVDIPSFHWPVAPFPSLKYPLEENIQYNLEEEKRCLLEFERIIKTWETPIAAIIVEPIQGEGGDNHASPQFFTELRRITRESNILMIVDEVQTGVATTGKFWAHEHWNLSTPPDFVTFSKKMQSGGVYHNLSTRAPHPYRNFNTWMGDPIRGYQAQFIVSEILDNNLTQLATTVGEYLKAELMKISASYPDLVANVRGQGTFMAFDSVDTATRDKIISLMRLNGLQQRVNMGGSGVKSVRLRPMLIFGLKHAKIFVEALQLVCKNY